MSFVGRAAHAIPHQDDAKSVVDRSQHRREHADIGLRSGDDEAIRPALAEMIPEMGFEEPRIPGLVDYHRRRDELPQWRQDVQQARIDALAGRFTPFLVVATPQVPGRSSGRRGVMKRVNTVRSGKRSTIARTTGSTRSIQGVAHGPSEEKMRCMSTHRCTARSVNGAARRSSAMSQIAPSFTHSSRRWFLGVRIAFRHRTTLASRASAKCSRRTEIISWGHTRG